jgi:hypothetical protein
MTQLYVNAALDFLEVSVTDYLQVQFLPVSVPTYPETPAPMEATVTSLTPTLVSVTNSLKRQARSRGAHRWEIDLRYGAMTRATFAPLWAFLVSREGQARSFTVRVPAMLPRGSVAGTPLVDGASQTGFSINTDGWGVGSLIYRAGDFVQFEGDPKVYMVTSDVTATGGGAASLPIYPALRRSPLDNTPVNITPLFTCALTGDMVMPDFNQCVQVLGFSVSLVEVLA